MRRLWDKTAMRSDGCIEWVAAKGAAGYGRIGIGATKTYPAHRIALVWALGHEVPPEFDVDHLCLNKSCVNPTHLEAVTRREHIARDGEGRGAATIRADLAGGTCVAGHDLTAERAWRRQGRGRTCRLCSNMRAAEWRARRRSA